jgi:hypothetical protein
MMCMTHSPDDMPKVTVTAFIEESLKDELKELADRERRSMSQMVALLIERAVAVAKDAGDLPSEGSK